MRSFIVGTTLLGLALVLLSCGEEGGGPVQPPVSVTVDFDPAPGTLTVGTFEDVPFAAAVANAEADSARFYVDDLLEAQVDVQGSSPSFVFQRTVEGQYAVRLEVYVTGEMYAAAWTVTVSTESVPLPPVVDALQVEPGDMPGSLEVVWLAPGGSRYVVPLKEYVVAWSTSPIDSQAFDGLSSITVAHREDVITQRTELSGLSERVLHYVAVRVRDVLDRESAVSEAVSSESTGHFDVSGVVRTVEFGASTVVSPIPNVLIDIDGHKTLTATDGRYALLGLPDLQASPLLAEEESGAIYYAVATDPLDPITREVDLLLFPRGVVELEVQSGGPVITTLDYLLQMTQNDSDIDDDRKFHPWAEYPITVFVHDYVFAPNGVDYALAFTRAIDNWNTAVNDELLRLELVASPPARSDPRVGVFYSTDLNPSGGSNLGQVEVVRPPGGALYEIEPEWLIVRLRDNFFTQEVADYIVTHELGHVLGLDHSPSRRDIMYFAVDTGRGVQPSEEEAFVARFLKNVGPGIESTWYAVPGGRR